MSEVVACFSVFVGQALSPADDAAIATLAIGAGGMESLEVHQSSSPAEEKSNETPQSVVTHPLPFVGNYRTFLAGASPESSGQLEQVLSLATCA